MEQNNQLVVVQDSDLIMHLENIGLLKNLKEGEKNTFIQIAKAFNLNPFKREIHVSKYGDNMSIIVGYETYIKRAERSNMLDGWEVTTQGRVEDNSLKAIITIFRKDRSKPFVWECKYSEYVQLKDGKPTKFWQKAETMTKKVAMAQGFRLCFNDELGGMPYTSEEMNDVDHEEINTPANTTALKATPVNSVTKKNLGVKGLTDAIGRFLAGEPGLREKLQSAFVLTPAQITEIDQAIAFHKSKQPLYELLNTGNFVDDEQSQEKEAIDRCNNETQYQELHKALTKKQ